jgi:CBS domain containing-hemolysin-like protein
MRLLLTEMKKWNNNKKLSEIKLVKPIKIPLNKPIDELLKTFQQAHQHIAIVIDEYGGVAWLITLEDIIEEVFWEIHDETDKEEEEIKKINENEYEVSSTVLLDDILKLLHIDISDLWYDEKDYSWETLSYFITDVLERFPNMWEKIKIWDLLEIKVLEVSDAVIWKILVKKLENNR